MRLEPSVTIPVLQQHKADSRPIAMVTAYDAGQARLADAAGEWAKARRCEENARIWAGRAAKF